MGFELYQVSASFLEISKSTVDFSQFVVVDIGPSIGELPKKFFGRSLLGVFE